MKKNIMRIKDNIIIIFILLILFVYIFSMNIVEEKNNNKEIFNLLKEKSYLFESFENDRADEKWGPFSPSDDFCEEKEEQFSQNNGNEQFDIEIRRLNNEISKRKTYIIFLSISAAILFLIIVIYSSIKCFILCTKRYEPIYRISYVNSSQCLAVSMAEYEEKKIDNKESKSEDYEAPNHASVKNNKKQKYKTINPDKYKSTKEDKDLYKPYNSEDFQ